VAQAALVLVATKHLKENGKKAINLKQMDRYCITKSKWDTFRLLVNMPRNSVSMDDFVYLVESKEDCLCFPVRCSLFKYHP
jgi:hypothetical protein